MHKNKIKVTTILQTGIEDAEILNKAYSLGASGILPKPYSKEELLEECRRHLS